MCWSMTNRAIGWCVMRHLRKGQIKWTRHPFVKETSGYLGFLNLISPSLLFSKSLRVGWRASHPSTTTTTPSERNWLSFDGESGSRDRGGRAQNRKSRATTNPWYSWERLHTLIPYIKGCVWVFVSVYVSELQKKTPDIQAIKLSVKLHYHPWPSL